MQESVNIILALTVSGLGPGRAIRNVAPLAVLIRSFHQYTGSDAPITIRVGDIC